ncbi:MULTISPECIES: TldD/PmbA family protein [unclassified Archaeoglobus]|jgi:TldD protein|uniref:TldD/PmbA family protein n=1 Tax=unclassified Archaeoglobus TaxID=2643606 RepID=UPI0025BD2A91|nr:MULTISPECIES: TldD/PmbA family protein [unclassified Archaeoglobus]
MEFYDIREVESFSLSLQLENGRIEKPRYDHSVSKGFRVLKNGFWGIFEGNVEDRDGLSQAEKNAIFHSESDIVEIKSEGSFEMRVKEKPEDIPIEEKVELLRDLERVIKDVCVSTKIVYIENLRIFRYRDSCGSNVSYSAYRTGVSITGVGKGETLQFFSRRLMKAGGFEILGNAISKAEEIREVLPALVNARSPPSGEMNVVMDPNLAGVFVHEAFGHAVEADHVLQGATVLEGRIGDVVADENVSIIDDPTIPEFGFFPFDDEGVRAEKKVIVEEGVLRSFLHSRETAKKLGGRAGNARSQGVDVPIVRMSNTYIAPSDYSFDELVEECKNGIYLVGSRGGETNPATGYFHFNAQYGYLIEKGEVTEMVRDVSLSGNTLEILKNVRIGCDLQFDPGFCGKSGQLVPVSDGSPHLLCRATVGGA